jgi:hypothetical protein
MIEYFCAISNVIFEMGLGIFFGGLGALLFYFIYQLNQDKGQV